MQEITTTSSGDTNGGPTTTTSTFEKGLRQIQDEIHEWSLEQFGKDNISKVTGLPQYSQCALTGLVEEVGELNGITIKSHQGRRGYDDKEKFKKDQIDAVADIMIFLCDYSAREGIDILEVLNNTWNNIVSKRTTKTREDWEKHTHTQVLEGTYYGSPPTAKDAKGTEIKPNYIVRYRNTDDGYAGVYPSNPVEVVDIVWKDVNITATGEEKRLPGIIVKGYEHTSFVATEFLVVAERVIVIKENDDAIESAVDKLIATNKESLEKWDEERRKNGFQVALIPGAIEEASAQATFEQRNYDKLPVTDKNGDMIGVGFKVKFIGGVDWELSTEKEYMVCRTMQSRHLHGIVTDEWTEPVIALVGEETNLTRTYFPSKYFTLCKPTVRLSPAPSVAPIDLLRPATRKVDELDIIHD